jgi:hypothetical protein
MKQCPQCRQTFTDDNQFCLSDGTLLLSVYENQEELTVVKSGQSFQFPNQNVQPAKQGVNPIFAYLTVGLLVLLVGIGVIVAGIFLLKGTGNTPQTTTVSNSQNANQTNSEKSKLDDQKADLDQKQAELEKEKQKLAEDKKKLNEQKSATTSVPVPPPPPTTKTYPPQPTARIKFASGAVASSVSGKVYTQRTYVLECRSGQYLSASINGSCARFSNGGTSLGYYTRQGDNAITVVNNCDNVDEASFSFSVAIR